MKLKTLALAAMMGLGTLPLALHVQAAELPEGRMLSPPGPESDAIFTGVSLMLLEVRYRAVMLMLIRGSHNILISYVKVALKRKISMLPIFEPNLNTITRKAVKRY